MSTSETGWAALILSVIAVLVAGSSVVGAIGTRRKRRAWTIVDATVVGHAKRTSTSTSQHGTTTSTHRVSRYRFTDSAGTERTGTDETGDKHAKGESLKVMYDPDDPERSESVSLGRSTTWVLVGSLVALPLALYGLQWGLAAVTGNEPLVEWSDPRLLWLDEDQIER